MEYKNQLEIEYVNDDIYKYAVNDIVELVKEDEETCYIKFHGVFLPNRADKNEPNNETIIELYFLRNDRIKMVRVIDMKTGKKLHLDYWSIIQYLENLSIVGTRNIPFSFCNVEYVGVN